MENLQQTLDDQSEMSVPGEIAGEILSRLIVKALKMENLAEGEEQLTSDDQTITISLAPVEIIAEILSRLPHNFAYVINPSTRKIFKLPGPASEPAHLTYGKGHICYFFGFDESRNEHKILTIRIFDILSLYLNHTIEIMIFSMLSLSWRKIDVDLPDVAMREWNVGTKHNVCVNSVIHLILQNQNEILAFDLRTEKFSIINLPIDVIPDATNKNYCYKGLNTIISNRPFLMKISGFLGVMCQNPVAG
ncbi:hypothetical protein L1987_76371 [Smallanthus sonchifolius]|uniref:Uncharacterized protein n=1 Tax=Smallanthus sonchifolius TaxID=185202 RepID=A0ACB9A852_9ASTR|nr:hypothetical protein L1987_76371 [Smallanthus sonchifolius]